MWPFLPKTRGDMSSGLSSMSDGRCSEHQVEFVSPVCESPPEKLTIDDMLQRECGDFGRWHLRQFVLSSLAWTLEAIHSMVMIFAEHEPGWRCLEGVRGSGCDGMSRTTCSLKPGSWEWIDGHRSTVAQWGLVCAEKYKVGLVQALFFVGCMMGAGVFGHLSDSFLGRKRTLALACIMNAVLGCLTAFSPHYWSYAILRLLTGISTGGVGLCGFVLATEPVGPGKRGVAGMSTFYFYSCGVALISGIAYFSSTWRVLYIASSMPSLLFIITVLPFIYESPRWYLIRGKLKNAMKLMSIIAKSNGKHLRAGLVLALDEEIANNVTSCDHTEKEQMAKEDIVTGTLIDVVRSPVTRNRLILSVAINFLCSVAYYGLNLNVANLGTNIYLNVLINAVSEMPAFMITALLINSLGRKPLTIGTEWFSGIFCMVGCLIGLLVTKLIKLRNVLRMICGVFGIFGIVGTYNLLLIYTAELFPTVVRNAALGCVGQSTHLGAILAPFVVILGEVVPFAVFGACGIAGGILAYFLPETLNSPMYDTMAGLESSSTKKGASSGDIPK